ncbi:MAG: hypothetical protein ACLFOY_05880 [Desulfatibacillaceae bacterium]
MTRYFKNKKARVNNPNLNHAQGVAGNRPEDKPLSMIAMCYVRSGYASLPFSKNALGR